MEQPKKILVPVDLSDRSKTAVAYASMLAGSVGAELVLMININMPERAALEEFAAGRDLSIEDSATAAIEEVITERAADLPRSRSGPGTSRPMGFSRRLRQKRSI